MLFRNVFVTYSPLLLCVLLAALERKISMRQSREELIKRGVLKEIYDKGKGTTPVSMSQKKSRAWNLCAYFLELDSVFCITLSEFEPLKLQTLLERSENVADSAEVIAIIEGTKAPFFSALESNHRMLRQMTWPEEWCQYCWEPVGV